MNFTVEAREIPHNINDLTKNLWNDKNTGPVLVNGQEVVDVTRTDEGVTIRFRPDTPPTLPSDVPSETFSLDDTVTVTIPDPQLAGVVALTVGNATVVTGRNVLLSVHNGP